MKEISCDIMVVGAGPAGSVSSIVAADEGKDVITVERKFQIASPLRGGEAVCKPFFDKLAEKMKIFRKVPKWEVKGTVLDISYCQIINKEEKWKAYVIDRKRMENLLAEEAIKRGCQLFLGSELVDVSVKEGKIHRAKIRSIDGNFNIKPRVIIAADGFASFFRRFFNLNKPCKDWASAIEMETSNINFAFPDMLQVFFNKYVPGGYSYIFPKRGGTNGLTGIAMRPFFENGKNPLDIFRFLRKNFEPMRTQLEEIHPMEIRGGCIDVSGPFKQPVHGNVIFVGDSANQNFAYIGEGLIPSIEAAIIAGKTASRFAENNSFKYLLSYQTKYEKTDLWKELMQTWKIKENIDDILLKSSLKDEIKLVMMGLLEMEIIDWTGKEIKDAIVFDSVEKLISFGEMLVDEKGLSIEIIRP